MVMVIASMKDELNGFMNLFLEKSNDIVKRNFMHTLAVAEPSSLFYSHPEDYSVWVVGTFDSDTGVVDLYATPELIVRGGKRV